MKKKIALSLVLACLLNSGVCFAGFDEGEAAHQRGDYTTALNEWSPLAEQGNAAAQYNLGLLFRGGKGVQQNHKKAVAWYRKAANQGYAEAESELGFMYRIGDGVKQNTKEAVKWYRKAADQGNVSARHSLGEIFMTPKGTELYGITPESSLVIAYAIHDCNTNYFPSQQKLSMLSRVMSTDDINEATALSGELIKPNNFTRSLDAYLKNRR